MNIIPLLSLIGTICGIVGNIAPILSVQQKILSNETEQIPQSYLFLNHFNQLLWLLYGIKVQLEGLILANAFTSLLTLVSLLLLKHHSKILTTFSLEYLTFVSVLVYSSLFLMNESLLGIICTVLGIVSFGSILESVLMVFKSSNPSFIDLKITFNIIITSVVWGLVGHLAENENVLIVNSFGISVGVILIITYLIHSPVSIGNSKTMIIQYIKSKVFREHYGFVL